MRYPLSCLLAFVMVAIGLGLCQRTYLWSWWRVRQLAQAGESDRGQRAKQVADLGEPALPHLIGVLAHTGDACANAEEALQMLLESHSLASAFGGTVLNAVEARFGDMSPSGKAVALRLLSDLSARVPDDGTNLANATVERLLKLAAHAELQPAARPAALAMVSTAAARATEPHWQSTWRAWVRKGLSADESATRRASLHLLLKSSLHGEASLLAQVAPLLKDDDPGVRKGALLALGGAVEIVDNEALLALLHDDDLEVQMQCEQVLRSRGLNDRDLRLARLVSDPRPATRCEVAPYLLQQDIDAASWLRRLSQDVAPSVRAAAARAAALHKDAGVRDLLHDMAQRDPSPTVRELAGHFLRRP
jgi:hypothetical protein